MWMLLEAWQAELAGSRERRAGRRVTPSEPSLQAKSQPASHKPPLDRNTAATDAAATVAVSVYLHPGRISVGTLDSRAAAEQFSLSASKVYADMGAAERANRERSGFLIDIPEACAGPDGEMMEPGVRFAERLR